MDALQAEIVDAIGKEYPKGEVLEAFDKEVRKLLRNSVLEHGKRVSGRGVNELRPISCEVGLLPRTHGTGLFNRGLNPGTVYYHAGVIAAGTTARRARNRRKETLMHHYNMPPFATGEVKRTGNPGRREIGHGALAERAVMPMIPKSEEFPIPSVWFPKC